MFKQLVKWILHPMTPLKVRHWTTGANKTPLFFRVYKSNIDIKWCQRCSVDKKLNFSLLFIQSCCIASADFENSIQLLYWPDKHKTILILCSTQKATAHRFGTTRGWVNNDRIFIVGWTISKLIKLKCIAWMHCKSLWIKVSSKCMNVHLITLGTRDLQT